MLGYMNAESLQRTVSRGQVWFWSRSRSEFWHKGETSGQFLNLRGVRVDCDGDALLVEAGRPVPTCHTGAVSCFFSELPAACRRAPGGERGPATASRPTAAHRRRPPRTGPRSTAGLWRRCSQ